MVVKTEQCAFSEARVYPGHGSRFIRRDGSSYIFLNSKCKSLFLQKKKPTKIYWTLASRRMHKKIKVVEVSRRRARKTTKLQRAIVGASVEDIKLKRQQKPAIRAAARDAALKEAKERSKKSNKAAGGKANVGAKAPLSKSAAPRASKKTGNRGKM